MEIVLIIKLICGGIASAIASSKGRNAVGWFFGGFIIDVIGVIIVACLSNLKVEEKQRRHAARETRRLREQLNQERMKSEAFRQHATSRLDMHDGQLSIDTRSAHAALPASWGQPSLEDPGDFLANLEQNEMQPRPPALAGPPPPSSPEKAPRHWYYEVNGQTMGPVMEKKLISMLRAKQIEETTLVWTEELDEWKEARRIRHLLRHIQS